MSISPYLVVIRTLLEVKVSTYFLKNGITFLSFSLNGFSVTFSVLFLRILDDLGLFVFILFRDLLLVSVEVFLQLNKKTNSRLASNQRIFIMQFSIVEQLVSKIKYLSLPGEKAHSIMMPPVRQQLLKKISKKSLQPRQSAVLAMFYPDLNDQARFVLILRETYKGVHSGQLSFPGGKFEIDDTSLEITALRETEEEIGLTREKIHIIRVLSQIYIPPSNFTVTPYLGIFPYHPTFVAQASEVKAIVEVPISELLNDQNTGFQKVTTSYAGMIEVPVYTLENKIVWGATAMILSELKVLLKMVL